jgi:hypothetical protein
LLVGNVAENQPAIIAAHPDRSFQKLHSTRKFFYRRTGGNNLLKLGLDAYVEIFRCTQGARRKETGENKK